MALSIMSIIFISFSSILINSTRLYKKELKNIENIQKSLLLNTWLKNKIDNSASFYISSNDGLLTIHEKDSDKLYKVILYDSQNRPAVGVKKYRYQDNILRYIEKEPIMNGVIDLSFEKIGEDINKDPILNIDLELEDSKGSYSLILN